VPVVIDLKNLQISAQSFAGPKNTILGFWWGACTEHTAQMPQFQDTGVISGASQHPKECLLLVSFNGDILFGYYDPQKIAKITQCHSHHADVL